MIVEPHKIRALKIYVSSHEAAGMVEKSVRWVQLNKHRFQFRRQNGKRNLEMELTSVLKVYEKMKKQDHV